MLRFSFQKFFLLSVGTKCAALIFQNYLQNNKEKIHSFYNSDSPEEISSLRRVYVPKCLRDSGAQGTLRHSRRFPLVAPYVASGQTVHFRR